MSKKEGAAAPLRAVPEGEAEASPEPTTTGLTPATKKAGSSRFISDVIVEMGFLARERVDGAVEEGKASGRSPEQVLVETGAITGDQLARAVAQRFGLHHVDLSVFKTDVGALNLITPQAARRLGAVPDRHSTRAAAAGGDVRPVERARARRPQADDRPRGACPWSPRRRTSRA